MAAPFINRFAIGFINFNMEIGIPGWLKGGLAGFVLSLPAAIISGKHPPIIVLAIVGGIICGLFVYYKILTDKFRTTGINNIQRNPISISTPSKDA